MTEADRSMLKAQLSIVQGLLGAAKGAANQPMMTSGSPGPGPVIAPGIVLLAQSLSNAIEQLAKVLGQLIEKS